MFVSIKIVSSGQEKRAETQDLLREWRQPDMVMALCWSQRTGR